MYFLLSGHIRDRNICPLKRAVRLEGNNATLGTRILNDSGLNVIAANTLTEAAQKIVAAVRAIK